MTTALVRVPDGVVRWNRWSGPLTVAAVVVQVAAFAGFLAHARGASAVLAVLTGGAGILAVATGIRQLRLRARLFPERSSIQVARDASRTLRRLLREGPRDPAEHDEAVRLAWWQLVRDADALWGGVFAVGLLGTQVVDEPLRPWLTTGHVVWTVLLVVLAAGVVVLQWSAARLRRDVAGLTCPAGWGT